MLKRISADRPVVFRKQHTLTIEGQRDLGRYFGPLHKHATYAVPRRGDLDDVVGEWGFLKERAPLNQYSGLC